MFQQVSISFTVRFFLTQIMLARGSTERKKFLLWDSEENEFETLFKVLLTVHGIDYNKLGKKTMTRFCCIL